MVLLVFHHWMGLLNYQSQIHRSRCIFCFSNNSVSLSTVHPPPNPTPPHTQTTTFSLCMCIRMLGVYMSAHACVCICQALSKYQFSYARFICYWGRKKKKMFFCTKLTHMLRISKHGCWAHWFAKWTFEKSTRDNISQNVILHTVSHHCISSVYLSLKAFDCISFGKNEYVMDI